MKIRIQNINTGYIKCAKKCCLVFYLKGVTPWTVFSLNVHTLLVHLYISDSNFWTETPVPTKTTDTGTEPSAKQENPQIEPQPPKGAGGGGGWWSGWGMSNLSNLSSVVHNTTNIVQKSVQNTSNMVQKSVSYCILNSLYMHVIH